MVGGAVPGAITGMVGGNQSWFIGDIMWHNVPAAASSPGCIGTTAGDPGVFSAMADLAA